ncbi:LPXTG cell wall anchor domain-containing protein [Streptomyces lasalocidi]|uniref:LPXTG cell wall anchor domain-containing protein n=1 Tax=Streptomyces lasalocidi TaxID=324833 RepID=A0A4U5WLV7_STRLS|nr:LPXTG cell wall anchor domain-containing protein [Streptomyces lasalocidi]TKT03049.1 LPXTG cell wall anchor domain-containing protein [Streptomyces lasalocidi]
MRRTVLSGLALAGTALFAGAVPAFADASPTQVPRTTAATAVPSAGPGTGATPRPAPGTRSAEPTVAPSTVPGQVRVVPSGAPDTGVAAASAGDSGNTGALVGGGTAVLAGAGAAFLVVRRRRATGA